MFKVSASQTESVFPECCFCTLNFKNQTISSTNGLRPSDQFNKEVMYDGRFSFNRSLVTYLL